MNFLLWVPYYFVGLSGIYIHILSDGGKVNPMEWIKAKAAEFVLSLLAYHLILTLWMVEGIGFFGMIVGQPSGMTLLVGYAGNSMLKGLLKAMTKKANLEESQDQPKP